MPKTIPTRSLHAAAALLALTGVAVAGPPPVQTPANGPTSLTGTRPGAAPALIPVAHAAPSPAEARRIGGMTGSEDNRVVLDLGGGGGGLVLPRISMTTLVVGSDASNELKNK